MKESRLDYSSVEVSPVNVARVLVVDDHKMMRQCLVNMLKESREVEVVGEAGDGKEALAVIAEVIPDVVVMDVSMPGMNGVETTKCIKQDYPDIRVIGLSLHLSQVMSETMYNAGASAYLTKDGPIAELIRTIGRVFQKNKISSTDGVTQD